MKYLTFFILSILLGSPLHGFAASGASSGGFVKALQMPAWLERNGHTYPLKAGTKIYAGDIIRTGKNSRILIQMQEGSAIKLGENSNISFKTLLPAKQKKDIFAALLHVSQGAFRFTTSTVGKSLKRNIDVKIGALTISIRGTDIWGRSSPHEDLFALLEGKVSVKHDGENYFSMRHKLSYIVAHKGQSTSEVMSIGQNELSDWVKETEVQQGRGIVTTDGEWALNVMSLQSTNAANALLQKLNNAGYASTVQQTKIAGKPWLRVRIEGFATRQDANGFASSINYMYGIEQPWSAKL